MGHVTLVGAGPGDPELLTRKAYRALQTATLVLYDHLVGPAVLDCIAPGAERIYVGKESSRHTLPQEQIIELMVRLARSGRNVVRLKGGDGYIFGRGARKCRPRPKPALALTWCPASPPRKARARRWAFRSRTATTPAPWCLPPATCAKTAPWGWTGNCWPAPAKPW